MRGKKRRKGKKRKGEKEELAAADGIEFPPDKR